MLHQLVVGPKRRGRGSEFRHNEFQLNYTVLQTDHDVFQAIQFLLSTVWNSCLRFWPEKAPQWLSNWKLPALFRRLRRLDVREALMFAECFLSLGHLNDDVTPILYLLTFGKDLQQTVNPLVLTFKLVDTPCILWPDLYHILYIFCMWHYV